MVDETQFPKADIIVQTKGKTPRAILTEIGDKAAAYAAQKPARAGHALTRDITITLVNGANTQEVTLPKDAIIEDKSTSAGIGSLQDSLIQHYRELGIKPVIFVQTNGKTNRQITDQVINEAMKYREPFAGSGAVLKLDTPVEVEFYNGNVFHKGDPKAAFQTMVLPAGTDPNHPSREQAGTVANLVSKFVNAHAADLDVKKTDPKQQAAEEGANLAKASMTLTGSGTSGVPEEGVQQALALLKASNGRAA